MWPSDFALLVPLTPLFLPDLCPLRPELKKTLRKLFRRKKETIYLESDHTDVFVQEGKGEKVVEIEE